MRKDIYLNEYGDIELGFDGDIKVSISDDVTVDNIIFRLKTYKGDFELEPNCGANLEDLIGEPNAPETGERACIKVKEALTHDGFLDESDFTVRASPLSITELLILIDIKGERGNFQVVGSLDLSSGQLIVRS